MDLRTTGRTIGSGCATRRPIAWLAAFVASIAWLIALPAPAGAAGVGFGVSAPADPITVKPGQVVDTWVGLSNQTDAPMSLFVRLATLTTRDDGRFDVKDTPDPLWASQV